MTLENLFLQSTRHKEPALLYQPIEYVLMQGGKRVRPQLVLMSTALFGGDQEQAGYIAAAFEMLHNFTLIHDDIMDNAPIRRGKETVYKKWNSNIAILSGDALANMALRQILKAEIDPVQKIEIVDLFSRTSLEVCEGQQYDLNFETSDEVTVADYLKMIRLKTAVMLAGCLKAGAIISGATKEDQEKIYHFGIHLGIAFQLKDDLLDIYADHELFGKMKGMDIQDNKKTYLYLRAKEDASKLQKSELEALFSASSKIAFEAKLERILQIYEDLSIEEKTGKLADEHIQEAISILESIKSSPVGKEELRSFTLQLCNREK